MRSIPADGRRSRRRADRLRRTVDVACAVLRQGRLSRAEAETLVAHARAQALALFPGKEDVFDLVLAPRFRRIVEEWCPAASVPRPARSGTRVQASTRSAGEPRERLPTHAVKSRITPSASK